ncbi:hypothetical protein PIIN_06321 [Serendipita indica DSM 11827]|uniref:Uncharacterized protein n=1 Tax=Serendipita indica (strain DSM 11827) TaxID=1109443 RepID=G4TM46_SERID|nr:hypothetical protein PIIN_06321 [Serendipita indica DSM 11827]
MAEHRHVQLYSYEELVSNIHRTVGVTVSQRDLAQPMAQLVELLYVKFLYIIFGFDFEDYTRNLHNEPDPQYADSFVVKVVLRHLKQIMRLTSETSWIEGKTPIPLENVRISDITEPTPARTKVILSTLINLVNLRDGEMDIFAEVLERFTAASNQRETSSKQIERLKAENEAAKAVIDQKNKALEEDLKKKEEREQELAEAERARKKTKQELKEIKNEMKQKIEQKENLANQVSDWERRNLDLQRRLVRSPDRVKNEILNMGDDVAQKREQVFSREEMNRAQRAKLDALQVIEKHMETLQDNLVTLQDIQQERNKQLSVVQSIRDQLEKQRIEYEDAMANKDSWEKKGETARQRITAYELKMAAERRDIELRTAEAKEEYERVTEERSQTDHRIDDDRAHAVEIQREIDTMIHEAEKMIQQTLNDYWRLTKQADEYMATIAKRLHFPLPTS